MTNNMKRLVILFSAMILMKIIAFSENISTYNETDSTVLVSAADLKCANLIFAEHQKLLVENALLNEQIQNYLEIDKQYEQIDSLRLKQINEYKNLANTYVTQIDNLNKELKKKNTTLRCWQIGGVAVSVGLILFLILK